MANIIELRKSINDITGKYNNIIGSESEELISEFGIDDATELNKAIETIENENRLLQIGIVGRVKAGKSSLLNALLFDGEAILPKAATPMTAALTQLSYGEEVSAEVEFYTEEDIDKIKSEALKYERELDRLFQANLDESKKRKEKKSKEYDLKELTSAAKKKAERSLRENISLSASYDQNNKMKNSGLDISMISENKIVKADNIKILSSQLIEYVGANGKYMPFTKSVHIKLPQENLKDLMIIDTPGVNDPVQSREARTRDLLKYCDVIFIVSPSGSFLSNEDIELMDRITAKEGVREIFVVSSQVDTQLMGSMKNDFRGELQAVLNGITSTLGEQLSTTMTQLKANSPEVGGTFDRLIEQGKDKVIHSSGICQTIRNSFDNKASWDDGTKKVWENLTREYPDNFTDMDKELSISNLDVLGNTNKINSLISDVREQKKEILSKRKDEFIKSKLNSLNKYKEGLVAYAEEQLDKVKNSDAGDLKKDKANLKKIQTQVSRILDEEYFDLVKELSININGVLISELSKYFTDTRKSIDDSESTATENYQHRVGHKFLWWGDKYETRTRTVASVRTGAVRSSLEDLTSEVENSVLITSQNFMLSWKKELLISLVKILRENTDDDELDPQLIRKSIRVIINSIKYPELDYANERDNFSELNETGTLTGSSAENYIESAREYLSVLKKRVTKNIRDYVMSLEKNMNTLSPSETIFGSYKERIEELEKQIENKNLTIDNFKRLIKSLGGIN